MVYELLPDNSHLEEEDEMVFDAELIVFDGHSAATFFHPSVDYQQSFGAPQVVEFVGNLDNAAQLDHIGTAPSGRLLVSARMVRVLESVGAFAHRLIPTVIYSREIQDLVRHPVSKRRTNYRVDDPRLRNQDFSILQLTDIFDCLDPHLTRIGEGSFAQSGREYLSSDRASHLELRAPAGGFPPVFFVPELLFYCFTEDAKQACDAAGLRGLWWRPQP